MGNKFDKQTSALRVFFSVDWLMLAAVCVLIVISLLAIYSASFAYSGGYKFIIRQGLAVCAGAGAMVFFATFNYQFYKRMGGFIYIASIILLVSVLLFGTVVNGTKRWINFYLFSFQPVELAKIMFILTLAALLDYKWKEMRNLNVFFTAMALLFAHFALIMLQPGFSSTLVYFPITLILLYVAGVDLFRLFCVVLFGFLALGLPLASTFLKLYAASGGAGTSANAEFLMRAISPAGWGVYLLIGIIILLISAWWFLKKMRVKIPAVYLVVLCGVIIFGALSSVAVEKSLKEYQRKRLIVFIKPEVDPLDSGYNTMQSKISLGSGRILGKGFLRGTQTQLGFLPEQHTDYIFSVIGEEGGFLFALITLLAYGVFIWRGMLVARDARDRFGSLTAVGISTMFAFHAVINIGMVMGIMPTAGVPLLMVSYGGSGMFASLCAVGILFSIQLRRHTH